MSWCSSHHEDSRNFNGKGRGASAPMQIANSKQRIWPYSYQNSAYNSDNTRACLTMTSEVTSNASPIDHHSTHRTCSGVIKSSKSLYNMGTSHCNRDPGESVMPSCLVCTTQPTSGRRRHPELTPAMPKSRSIFDQQTATSHSATARLPRDTSMSSRKGGLDGHQSAKPFDPAATPTGSRLPPRRTVSMSRLYQLAQPRRRYLEETLKWRKNLNNLPSDQMSASVMNAMTTSMLVTGTPGAVPSNFDDPMIKSMCDLPSSRTPLSASGKRMSVRRPLTDSGSRSRNVLAKTPEAIEALNNHPTPTASTTDRVSSSTLVKSRSAATSSRTTGPGASSTLESGGESATSGKNKLSSRAKKEVSKRKEEQKEHESRRKEKEREDDIKMKQAEKEASEKIKREKEERRRKEAEEEALRVKAQKEHEERLAREEEERVRREEEEALRLSEQLKKAEEEKLLKAIEEHKRRQEEERKRLEEENKLRLEREAAEARAREEAEKARIELELKLKKDEEERLERKKRVEAIMTRTRKTPTSKTTSDAEASLTPSSSLIVPPDQGNSSGVSSLTSRDSLTTEGSDAPPSPPIGSAGNGSITYTTAQPATGEVAF